MSLNDPRRLTVPTPPQGVEIASFPTYLEAQKAVDTLADGAFAVQAVTIVGSDLRMVERVTGRLNYPRVALAGALSGAWFGLFIGLVLSLFNANSFLVTILICAAIGAAFGMLFGVISYSFTGGKRDFTSSSQVVASRYAVLCLPELADDARGRLHQAGAGGTVPAQQRPAAQGWAPQAQGSPTQPQGYPAQTQAQGYPAPAAPRPASPAATEPPRYGQRLDADQLPPAPGQPTQPGHPTQPGQAPSDGEQR